MTNLDGKTVIVTGAGGGVGRGIAIALAWKGAAVGLLVRRGPTGTMVEEEIRAEGGQCLSLECDVTDHDAIARSVATVEETFGPLDGVIHNAISGRSSQPEHMGHLDASSWEDHTSVALRPCFWLAQLTHKSLWSRGGSFTVLTSVDGIEGDEDMPVYSTVKGAQRGFIRSLAREWGPHGARANCLGPLAVTPALERAMELDPTLEARVRPLVPLGRFGDPITDIGPAAAFLCSDDARFVTGQTLLANGGRYTAL